MATSFLQSLFCQMFSNSLSSISYWVSSTTAANKVHKRLHYVCCTTQRQSFIHFSCCLSFWFASLSKNQTWGKPAYTAQAPDEQLEPSQELNETEVLNRGKRQVTFTLANVCPAIITSTGSSNSPSNSHPCVKRWYLCLKYNLYEAECQSSAWSCLSSIPRHGYMKCTPIIKTVIINKGTNNEKHVRLNKTCTCA